MNKPKTKQIGLIVGPEVGNEPEAIRQTAEYFGYQVVVKYLGRPNDFIHLLQGKDRLFNQLKIWILSMHGEEEQFILPELDDSIYKAEEPKGKIGHEIISQHAQIKKQLILNTGCSLGSEFLARAFIQGGARAYIGPVGYVEGNAALLFVTHFLYELTKNGNVKKAHKQASAIDEESALFQLFTNR